jgi:hypothetical protein
LCLFLGWLFDIGAGVRERVTWWIGLLVGWFYYLQRGSFIQKKENKGGDGPVQLSKVSIYKISSKKIYKILRLAFILMLGVFLIFKRLILY